MAIEKNRVGAIFSVDGGSGSGGKAKPRADDCGICRGENCGGRQLQDLATAGLFLPNGTCFDLLATMETCKIERKNDLCCSDLTLTQTFVC